MTFVLDALTGRGVVIPLALLIVVAALIFAVTSRLAQHADVLADETGLGRIWIGAVLLAASTSLPELLTIVSAGLMEAPDIGIGDLLGASLANLVILACLDLVFARRRIMQAVAVEQTLTALLAIFLAVVVGVGIFTRQPIQLGHAGLETVLLGGAYLGGMALLYRSTSSGRPAGQPDAPRRPRLRAAAVGFALSTTAVAGLAPLLVLAAKAVSAEAGVSSVFVGTLLVGLTTSFPELSATIAAVRLGALDLAVANVFGSVAFNVFLIVLLDLTYLPGPILGAVAPSHLLSVLLIVACLTLGIAAIVARTQRRPAPARLESLLILGIYAAGMWMLAGLPE